MLTKEQKAKAREAYARIWTDDPHMVDYCTNKVGAHRGTGGARDNSSRSAVSHTHL